MGVNRNCASISTHQYKVVSVQDGPVYCVIDFFKIVVVVAACKSLASLTTYFISYVSLFCS